MGKEKEIISQEYSIIDPMKDREVKAAIKQGSTTRLDKALERIYQKITEETKMEEEE